MGAKKSEVKTLKNSILAEIFDTYKHAGILYNQTTDPEIRNDLLAIKHGCDLIIARLSPLDVATENLLAECAGKFHKPEAPRGRA